MPEAIFYQDDQISESIEFEEQIIDCKSCPYDFICCKNYYVPLSPYEAEKLPLHPKFECHGMTILDQKTNGECVHFNEGRCGIWEDRPIACREYDCHKDTRISELTSG